MEYLQNAKKLFWQLVSFIFQPIFIPVYTCLLMMYSMPYSFSSEGIPAIIYVIIYLVIYPFIALILLRLTGFISGLGLKNRKERIIPYIISGAFYLWFYINVRKNPEFPLEFNVIILGYIISLFSCFFSNNFNKVSLHTSGMGAFACSIYLLMTKFNGKALNIFNLGDQYFSLGLLWIFLASILCSGLVGTARIRLKAHSQTQVWIGYIIGVLSMVISLNILNYE